MCGFLGHVVDSPMKADPIAVRKGAEALAHRGPDGNGQVDVEQCSLAHRRLSVIDIQGSSQPWQSACGRFLMVFNGEIYNYVELKNELQAKGVRFRSDGDTEVLMNLFIEQGIDCLSRLNGMFAFAVWDKRDRRLYLARDRMGEKPLYYSAACGQLAFASELAGLEYFKFIDRCMDAFAIGDFFAHQFIGGERTIYSGVRKLMPAHYLVWQKGQTEVRRYWSIPCPNNTSCTEEELCEELAALIESSVRLRLRSDVPLGTFLSGGLDSSLIAHVMRQQGGLVEAFTIGFIDKSYDESDMAEAVANELEIVHHLQKEELDDVGEINSIIDSFGEPYADPSAVPTSMLCRFAHKRVTVALSGDGVDELFGGYRRYYARALLERLPGSMSLYSNKIMNRLVQKIPESSVYYGNSLRKKLRLIHGLLTRIVQSPRDPLAQTFTLEERTRLLKEERVRHPMDLLGELDIPPLDPVSTMLIADQLIYLPEDILTKVDRMSMRHGLEVRSPFLDHRLVEFAARLPLRFKMRKGIQKYLIKSCYAGQLPEAVLKRAKHGFAVPLGRWFREGLRKPFEQLVLDGGYDVLNRGETESLWRDHQQGRVDNGFKLWSIYVFCRWYYRHVGQ